MRSVRAPPGRPKARVAPPRGAAQRPNWPMRPQAWGSTSRDGASRAGRFADQSMQQRKAERLHFATRDGIPDGATRLLVVTTIAEAAFANERAELDKGAYKRIGRDMRKTERLHPRRVNDPRPFAERGKGIERGRRRRMTSG